MPPHKLVFETHVDSPGTCAVRMSDLRRPRPDLLFNAFSRIPVDKASPLLLLGSVVYVAR